MYHQQTASYIRDWEVYPDGRQMERVMKIFKGKEMCVARISEQQDVVEFVVTLRSAQSAEYVEYDRGTFGRKLCKSAEFEQRCAEMASFTNKMLMSGQT